MVDTVIAALSLAIAIAGSAVAWLAARRAELRRDQVYDWASHAIDSFQTLALLVKPDLRDLPQQDRVAKIQEVAIQLSVLTEHGRILFKNAPAGDFGKEKEIAYRGLRPLILDELVIAHQLACRWRHLNQEELWWAFETSVTLLKRFVSLAQLEVGREKTASSYTKLGGDGTSFEGLLEDHRRGIERTRIPIAAR